MKRQPRRTVADEARALCTDLRTELCHGVNLAAVIERATPEDRAALRRLIGAAYLRRRRPQPDEEFRDPRAWHGITAPAPAPDPNGATPEPLRSVPDPEGRC